MALKNKTHDVEKASTAQRAPQQQQETARAASEHPRPVNAAIALQRAANSPPSALRPADILVLQRTVGNRAVGRMLSNRSQARPPQSSTPANAVQLKTEGEEQLQAKFETDRMRENRTGLPDGLKSGIESLSGMAMDGVNVHFNSSQPAQLNALAYTRGSDIYVAPGQERHLPHEAWHVVQQARGRVRPTMQLKEGVPVNDDEGLEHEADVMGAKALTHGGSSSSVSVTQKTDGLSIGNSSEAPVQRLIGFEVEYQVPTFGRTEKKVRLRRARNRVAQILKRFLFGGFKYGTKLGGSAKRGENSFRLTTDHDAKVSREPVSAKLDYMWKLDPTNSMDRDASSNLEYVTSPVDELAKGSDKVLSDLIDKVSQHAAATFTIAGGNKAGKIPAPASDAETGMPDDKFREWLLAKDYEKLRPILEDFRREIKDSCYIQATIGVLPGAVRTLFVEASDKEGLHDTGEQYLDIYNAVRTASREVDAAVSEHPYIKDLEKNNSFKTISSIEGITRLLVMYLVGDALSKTSAFPGGNIKNAVPFLVKVNPEMIANSRTDSMVFDGIPDDFVKTLAEQIDGRNEITVNYWRDLGYRVRHRYKDDWVAAGTVLNLTKMFLQGKMPGRTDVQTGSTLDKLDTVKTSDHNEGQKGIPLEYRYVKARPKAAGLKAELLKIVKEARYVNLSQSSEEERKAIEEQVKK